METSIMAFDRKVRRSMGLMAVTALLGALAPAASAQAQTPDQFYKGKNVSMLIGYSAGGGYDTYARLLARHLGKHIPGNPGVLPQNMTGAGSLRAASYLYTAAPKDGTVIATFARGMAIFPLINGSNQFDGTKFTWLGSMTQDVSLCIASSKSKIKTLQDLLDKPSNFGGEGPGSDPDIFASMYKNVFKAPIKLVTGYHGTSDMMLAMERGEIDGLCGISWSTMKASYAQYMNNKQVTILVQAASKKDPDLPNVPLATDLAKTDQQKKILALLLDPQEMARPFAAPPAIPADRAATLRTAFEQTMKDPEFLADAKKMNADINPVSAERLDSLVKELYATPKPIVDEAKKSIQ
jgi:tripartite-type tricarboxylate transporter receptor subunit TctC